MKHPSLLLFLAGAAVCLPVPSTHAAIHEWAIADGGNGHFYETVPVSEAKIANDAEFEAASRGGHLVHINSAEENAFVFSKIMGPEFWFQSGSTYNGPLLGAYQPAGPDYSEPDGGWQWFAQNGHPQNTPMTYTNWRPGQPDNFGGDEGAILFWNWDSTDPSPYWNDVYALVASSYVIEYDTDPRVSVPDAGSSLMLLAGAMAGLAVFKRR